jgi:hypothetical protein
LGVADDLVPRSVAPEVQMVIRAAASTVPVIGPLIGEYVIDRYGSNLRRAADFVRDASHTADVDADTFLRKVADDEGLQELFDTCMQAACRTRLSDKRRVLARVVGKGWQNIQADAIDQSILVANAIADLEPVDIRGLMRIDEVVPKLEQMERVPGVDPARIGLGSDIHVVLAKLERNGLIRWVPGVKPDRDFHGARLWMMTTFGTRVLAYIKAVRQEQLGDEEPS